MIDIIRQIDQHIPFWEFAVIGAAIAAIFLVLILWWAFGYNLVAYVPEVDSLKPAAFTAVF
jgi:hypothetical protein